MAKIEIPIKIKAVLTKIVLTVMNNMSFQSYHLI